MYPEDSSGISIVIVAAVAIVVVLLLGAITMSKLYKRATKEMSFVRTGLGGEKVIKNGGALVIPMFHEILLVNMQTLRIEVRKVKEDALITLDRMRIDISADFYLRVKPDLDGISMAAQTLGSRTVRVEEVKSLIQSKFVDVLRSVAAEMSMDEIHEKRADFVQRVQRNVATDLEKNGLELESVSLTGFDQTDLEYFRDGNAFDADGKSRLAKIIEAKRKITNDITQQTRIEIEERDLEAQRQSLQISRDTQKAEIDQQRELAEIESQQQSDIAKAKERSQQERETVEIERQQMVEAARIENSKKTEQAEIHRQQAIEEAEQDKAIAIANKSEEENAARAKAAEADKDRVEKEESVITARALAEANRAKEVAVTKARQEAEEKAQSITVTAEAEKVAATDRADARRIEAIAIRDAEIAEAAGSAEKYEVEAKGVEAINNAKNLLSEQQVNLQKVLAQIAILPEIISESVKPLSTIDGIKILQGWGAGSNAGGNAGANSNSGGLANQITDAALSYRANGKLVDGLLRELGMVSADGTLQDLVRDGGVKSLEDAVGGEVEEVADAVESEVNEELLEQEN